MDFSPPSDENQTLTVGGVGETWGSAAVEHAGRTLAERLRLRPGSVAEHLAEDLSTRLFLFVAVAALGVTLDLMVRAGSASRGAHPFFHHWWYFVVMVAGVAIVRSTRAAALAGLAAGGTIALALDNRMQQIGGHLWSVGFVLAFVGSIGIELVLFRQIVTTIRAIRAQAAGGGSGADLS